VFLQDVFELDVMYFARISKTNEYNADKKLINSDRRLGYILKEK